LGRRKARKHQKPDDKGNCGQKSGKLAKATMLSWIYSVKEDFIGEQEDGKR